MMVTRGLNLLVWVVLAASQLWLTLNAGGVAAIEHTGQVLSSSGPELWQDHTLGPGESMVNQVLSSSAQRVGTLTLKMESDCNLVVYGVPDGQAMWSSQTDNGSPTCQLNMQADGNLVIYDQGQHVWSTKTDHGPASGPYFLAAQGDGNVVVYGNRQAMWSTQTVFPQ